MRARTSRTSFGTKCTRGRRSARGTEDEDTEEAESPRARVILTTIHGAKGLEADFVHVAGLTDWLLPSRFQDTLIDRVRRRREEDHLAEELRELYVAMTRAQSGLTLWVPCGTDGSSRAASFRLTVRGVAASCRSPRGPVPETGETLGGGFEVGVALRRQGGKKDQWEKPLGGFLGVMSLFTVPPWCSKCLGASTLEFGSHP